MPRGDRPQHQRVRYLHLLGVRKQMIIDPMMAPACVIAIVTVGHQRSTVGGFYQPIDDGDVGMIQSRQDLCFAVEAGLMATSRCSCVSSARCTSPIPPLPSGPTIPYRAGHREIDAYE